MDNSSTISRIDLDRKRTEKDLTGTSDASSGTSSRGHNDEHGNSRSDGSVLSHIRSRKSTTSKFQHPLTKMKTGSDVIVDFDGPGDPYMAMNWSVQKRTIITAVSGFSVMTVGFTSSIFATASVPLTQEYHIGQVTANLGVSLYLIGLGVGPMLFAPLSEVYGRFAAIFPAFFISMVFSFATATAKDIQTVFLTRFFGGVFGSSPLTVTAGIMADLWPPKHRGRAMQAYGFTIVGGPLIAPVVGGAFVDSSLGWRWTQYIVGIMQAAVLILFLIFVEETYPPTRLVAKAKRLRYTSGNWALHAKHEEWDVSIRELAEKFLVRPLAMFFDPICLLMGLYGSFVFSLIYLSFPAFPVVYQEERGWGPVTGGLPFLSVLVGATFGGVLALNCQGFYIRRLKQNNYRPVPEARLLQMMIGAPVLPAGLFIFGWTSPADIHWIGTIIGACCIGFAFFTIFPASLNYIVDTFQMYAASAMATFVFMRCILAGALALVALPLFHNLGVDWACSLLGFCAVGMVPIPYLFYAYGKKIRAKGRWSKASI